MGFDPPSEVATITGTERPPAGSTVAAMAAAATNATLNSTSYSAKTKPRCASSTVRCTVASTLTLTPWAVRPKTNPAATSGPGRNGRPRISSATPAVTISAGTHQPAPHRRTAAGVSAAPIGTPTATATKVTATPRSPASASVDGWKVIRWSSTITTVMTPNATRKTPRAASAFQATRRR